MQLGLERPEFLLPRLGRGAGVRGMKFGEQLDGATIPEWRDFYVRYEGLKVVIDNCKEFNDAVTELIAQRAVLMSNLEGSQSVPRRGSMRRSDARKRSMSITGSSGGPPGPAEAQPAGPAGEIAVPSPMNIATEGQPPFGDEISIMTQDIGVLMSQLTEWNAIFTREVDKDMVRVETFYLQKLAEYEALIAELVEARAVYQVTKSAKLKRASLENFREIYKGLDMLKTYASTNETALIKIIKKRDKNITELSPMKEEYGAKIRSTAFSERKSLDKLQAKIVEEYSLFVSPEKPTKKGKASKGFRRKHASEPKEKPGTSDPASDAPAKLARKRGAKKALYEYANPTFNAGRSKESVQGWTGFFAGTAILCLFLLLDVCLQFRAVNSGENASRDSLRSSAFDYSALRVSAGSNLPLTSTERSLTRMHLTVSLFITGIGVNMFLWERKRINYVLILEFPPGRIVTGYRRVLLIGMASFTVSFLCTTLAIVSNAPQAPLQVDLEMPFGVFIGKFAEMIPAIVWLALPLIFPIVFLFSVVFSALRGRKGAELGDSGSTSISRLLITFFLRLFAPWKYRVTFPLFFFGDQLTSMSQLITDFLNVVTWGYLPSYIVFLFILLPNVIRAIQCVKKYREARQWYPHILNLCKYLVSLPAALLTVAQVRANRPALLSLTCVRVLEQGYKFYWDVWEDWALFSGGAGGKVFRSEAKERAKQESVLRRQEEYSCLLQRPSCFRSLTFCVVILVDFLLRFLFLVGIVVPMVANVPFLTGFYYQTLEGLLEVFRRVVWNVFRLDNQQATNCEGYIATRFVPLLITEQDRAALAQSKKSTMQDNSRLIRQMTSRTLSLAGRVPPVGSAAQTGGGEVRTNALDPMVPLVPQNLSNTSEWPAPPFVPVSPIGSASNAVDSGEEAPITGPDIRDYGELRERGASFAARSLAKPRAQLPTGPWRRGRRHSLAAPGEQPREGTTLSPSVPQETRRGGEPESTGRSATEVEAKADDGSRDSGEAGVSTRQSK